MSWVGRPPRVNPFSTRFVQPGAVPFLFPGGLSAAVLAGRLEAAGGLGQIVGPHGSGKSTLLAALLPALTRWRVRYIRLNRQHRVLPDGMWAPAADAVLIAVDGFEQLGLWTRRRVKRWCRSYGAGLLVTAHRSVGLPTLYRTNVTPEAAARVIDQLIPPGDRALLTGFDVATRLAVNRGSLRDVLFELYDRWSELRPGAENQASRP